MTVLPWALRPWPNHAPLSMTDLSQPNLTLAPLEDAPPPFLWPTPPFAAYPAPAPQQEPQRCEVEGLNGNLTSGKLSSFDPAAGVAHVLVPPGRSPMPLRFAQFRRLTLGVPLEPLIAEATEPHADIMDHRPATDYRITLAAGGTLQGRTVGHIETGSGLFLFPPHDARGAVRRSFVPREAYTAVEFGPKLGEVLVEQRAATLQQVEAAAREQEQLRQRKLGDVLVTRRVVEPEQLLQALEAQARMPMVRIGEALLALDLITELQLQDALKAQQADRSMPLGQLLVRAKIISRQDLQAALARKMGYPVVDVEQFPVEAEAVRRLPYSLASRLNALPLMLRQGRLIVALEDPSRREDIDELEFVAQCKVVPTLAMPGHIEHLLSPTFQKFGAADAWGRQAADSGDGDMDAGDDASKLVESLEMQSDRDSDEPQIEQSDNSLVRLINSMILEAHGQGVSDIHIETQPGRDKVRIRFRKDGHLKPYLELPHTYRSAVVARLKIMCDLDISERRKPQDGKINFAKFSPGHRLELRVATIPTNNGLEDVVLRLLASARPMPMDRLGLAPMNLERLKQAVERPYGMVLCVGPTGSGKTTTLHSALGHINTPVRKIWTAEDPIEITQAGLRQVQVNPKIDWTFAKALRSFLRADPDVIMVGEIRDRETAQMAIEASLTGHLVLSTLHTNSAPETVTRLLDMGMDPFNFGDSLLAVLAQRLVRRLCPHCRVVRDATDAQVDELLADHLHAFPEALRPEADAVREDWLARFGRDGKLPHHASPGCAQCDHTGYRGRAGLHEMLVVSRALRRLIQTGARVEELQQAAMVDGMRTLRQDGIEKVLQGLTSIEEVRATSNV
jgi:type II secretory ATPase GspE/PulE/Tfp pilus assembly ATPase PilB-like protein